MNRVFRDVRLKGCISAERAIIMMTGESELKTNIDGINVKLSKDDMYDIYVELDDDSDVVEFEIIKYKYVVYAGFLIDSYNDYGESFETYEEAEENCLYYIKSIRKSCDDNYEDCHISGYDIEEI